MLAEHVEAASERNEEQDESENRQKERQKENKQRSYCKRREREISDMYLSELESSGIEQILGNQNEKRSAPMLPPQAASMYIA